MKILVISLAGIGDTLIATPLFRELRLNFPEARIDALVLWPASRELLQGNPSVHTVHQQNFLRCGRWETLRFLWRLRGERYDLSLNTHPQSRIHYRIAARIIGAPVRVSHEYDNFTVADRWLINRSLPQDYGIHSIENNLRLLQLVGKAPVQSEHSFELFLKAGELATAADFIRDQKLTDRRLLGIHIGSGKTKNLEFKRWPLPNWIELLRRVVLELPDVTVLLFGGPEEQRENNEIRRELPSARIVPAWTRTIREAAALLGHCELFLSVDNALMHFAAAMKVPKQILIETPTFGPTLEPYRRPYRLVTNPAVHGHNLEFYRYDGRGISGSAEELTRCMMAVTADAVFKTLVEALQS